jgi:hypothetical protein
MCVFGYFFYFQTAKKSTTPEHEEIALVGHNRHAFHGKC